MGSATSRSRLGVVVVFAAFAAACGPIATHPIVPGDLDDFERMSLYREYKLEYSPSWFWGPRFHRKDDTYSLSGITDLVSPYPSTDALHTDASTRAWVIGSSGGVGISLLVIALGNDLTTPEGAPRPSPAVQITLYSAGAGLLMGSLIAETTWEDPGEELARDYNKQLLRELGIAETARRARPKTRLQFGLGVVRGSFW